MSLILDALNKSEQERPDSRAVPGLQTIHEAEDAGGRREWKGFAWPLVAVIFALVAVAGWLVRPSQMPVSVPVEPLQQLVPTPETPPVKSAEIVPVEAKIAPAPMPAPELRPPGSGNVAALYGPTPTPAPTVAASAEPGLAPEQDEPATAADIDVDALTRAARKALAERPEVASPVAENLAPLISDLNQNIKDEIPTLYFSVHRWNSMPGSSEVVINGKTYREGDLVKPGLRLTEILESSIVLDYRGTPFRLRSLNSWVNL